MKTPPAFAKDFDSPEEGWKFLSYLGARLRQIDISGLKLEFDGKFLKATPGEGNAALKDLLQKCFESGNGSTVRLFCDGGSRGNPGPGASGFVILGGDDEWLAQGGQFFERCTNNYAEYMSLKDGVEEALKRGMRNLDIYMDSQLVVKQIKGEYKIKSEDLLPIYQAVKTALKQVASYEISYIPRSRNRLADSVVNQILDQNT